MWVTYGWGNRLPKGAPYFVKDWGKILGVVATCFMP